MERRVVLEELHISTTALQTICHAVSILQEANWPASPTLKLDLVLNDEGLVLVVDLLRELGGDGVVSGLVFEHETLVALNALENTGLLNGPGADIRPFLLGGLVVLLCV